MDTLYIRDGYKSKLDILETERAIKLLKDFFERELSNRLNLTRISAPLFVLSDSGLNDDLNGVERPVSFGVLEQGDKQCEIVHSLAKWKRSVLKRYPFSAGQGIYTDMDAIRRDETTDNIHSLYVDQWDWERIIAKSDRNIEFLKQIVKDIYRAFLQTQDMVNKEYGFLQDKLPPEITFVTSQQLLDMYPDKTVKERENIYVKEKKAVFIMQIGGKMSDGTMHDGRAPDYDDWQLNGDLMFYNPIMDSALEMSSMGIRVCEDTLLAQLSERGCLERLKFKFHDDLINRRLPYTIGGGIGQSRMCMFFLEKMHIGEVQASVWPPSVQKICKENNIELL